MNIDVTQPPYNAVGDGVADDTAAIQAGVDACTEGDCVVFPADRTFIVNSKIGITLQSNKHLDMRGATLAILANGSGAGVQRLLNTAVGSQNITILGGIVRGSRTYVGGLQWNIGLRLDGVSNVLVDGTAFEDHYSDGIYIGGNMPGCVNVQLRGVRISNSGRNGMSVAGGSKMRFYDCIFEGSNNTDLNMPRTGIDFEPGMAERVDDVVINDCIFRHNTGWGLLLQSKSKNGADYSITNCTFESNGPGASNGGAAINQVSNVYFAHNKVFGQVGAAGTPGTTARGFSFGAGLRNLTAEHNEVGVTTGPAWFWAGVENPIARYTKLNGGTVTYVAPAAVYGEVSIDMDMD
jgi:polygalacturonase